MPKNEVTYRESVNLRALARELKERYFLHLGYVDLEAIYFAEKIGEKPVKSPIMDLSGIKSPWVRQLLIQHSSNTRYCLATWLTEWSELPVAQQEWMMFDALYSVGPENDGKIRTKDVHEHGIIADFLGVYWRNDKEVPSLLRSKDPLPIPPPPIDHEEAEDATID